MADKVTIPWHHKDDVPYKASVPGLYFHDSKHPVKLFGGAVGGTKTTTLATEILYLSMNYENNRGFAGERDFDDLRRGLYNEILEWLPVNQKLTDGRDLYQHHKSEHWLKFFNGSEIHFIELKDEPRNVNLGWAAIDQAERVPEKSYEWLHTRLRLWHVPYRPLMMSANPEPGWLYRKCVLGAEPENTGIFRKTGDELVVYHKDSDILFIPSFPEDNDFLPEGYIDSLYKNLSPTRVDRLLKGIWETVENAIYPQLDRSIQLKPLPRDAIWTDGAGGADFGTKHLSSVVAINRDFKTGNYWVRACWADATGDPQRIEDVARGHKIKYDLHKGRTDPIQAVLAANLGWKTAKMGHGSRQARINQITRLLNSDSLFFDIDGPGVVELFEEAMAYRYQRVETDLKEADVVVRKDDDRVAAMEYAIEELVEGNDYTPPTTRTITYTQRPASNIRTLRPRMAPSSLGYRLSRR